MRAAVLLTAVAAGACARPAPPTGRWTPCTCDYQTDTDVPGQLQLDACVARVVPEALAQRCASDEGVGRVVDCRCGAPREACVLQDGLCRVP